MVTMTGTSTENYIVNEQYIVDNEIVTAIEHVPCVHMHHGHGCPGCIGRLTYIKNGAICSTCGHQLISDTHRRVFKTISKTNNRW